MRLMPWWWGWGVKHILWQNEWVIARNWPWHLAWQQGNRMFFTNSTQHIMFSEAKARNLKFFDDDRMSEIIITAWRNTYRCKETKAILVYLAFGDFSTMTGTLSGYFLLIFSPSALLFSKGCSSLYCIRSGQQLRHGKIPKIHILWAFKTEHFRVREVGWNLWSANTCHFMVLTLPGFWLKSLWECAGGVGQVLAATASAQ